MCAQLLQSRLTPAAPWARVCQAPWCMRFSRQEYWNGASWRPLLLFSQTSNEKNMCVSLSQITHTHTALFTPSTTFDPAPFPQLRTRLHTPQRPHRLLHTWGWASCGTEHTTVMCESLFGRPSYKQKVWSRNVPRSQHSHDLRCYSEAASGRDHSVISKCRFQRWAGLRSIDTKWGDWNSWHQLHLNLMDCDSDQKKSGLVPSALERTLTALLANHNCTQTPWFRRPSLLFNPY